MIQLFEPSPDINSLKLIKKVFKSKNFLKGKFYRLFFENFSTFQNLPKNKITFAASCTDLIFNIMYTYKDVIKDKIVLIPSNSFPAIPAAVLRSGLKLQIVDIDRDTGNISFDFLKKLNKSKIGCIFLTHYGGNPVDIDFLRKILNKNTLIFEDCAGALGSFHLDGSSVGSKGDFSCWSFDSMKMITCGEGGAAYIKSKKIYRKFCENLFLGLKNKQQSGSYLASKKNKWWEYQPKSFGVRSIFTEIDAAIGLTQFLNIKKILKKRKILNKEYEKNLLINKNVNIIKNQNGIKYSNYFFTIFAKNRNKLARYLYDNGVYTSMRYYPINKIKIYSKYTLEHNLENSNYFDKYALNLPIHQNLKLQNIVKISQLINKFYNKFVL